MKPLVAISLGGVLGSVARFAIAVAIGPWDAGALPWATLTVNLVGCVAIGAIAASTRVTDGPSWLRPFLITGVLGGFTTFSALALETGVLMDAGRLALAVGYVTVTMAFGLVAVRLGTLLVRRPL